MPAKPGPKSEPTAPNLIASLVHPDRTANVTTVQFSSDGAKLFTSGYPSGIVQIWDVESRKETRRFDTPAGYKGSAEYALLSPDCKTMYVPVVIRKVKTIEKDGKQIHRIDHSGEIRVWDVDSGKEKAPLRPAAGCAPVWGRLALEGKALVCVERPSHDSTDEKVKDQTMVWDLTVGTKRKLTDGFAIPEFLPDGRTVVLSVDREVEVREVSSGKTLAKQACPEKDRFFSVNSVSPDGAVVAVLLGGKKGAPFEVLFFDAKTLADRGKLVGKGDPDRYGWGTGKFTPDGKRFVMLDYSGNALLWNVAEQKVERSLPIGGAGNGWRLAISSDGKAAAIGWMPKSDAAAEETRDPDPRDLPQPRVLVLDLTGSVPPRVLIAPHGYVGGLTFSPDGKKLAFGSAGAVHLFELSK